MLRSRLTRLSGLTNSLRSFNRLTQKHHKLPFTSYQFKRTITNAFQGMPSAPPPPPHRTRPFTWAILLTIAIAFTTGGFGYFNSHNYPPEVATKLRKALRAELDGAGQGNPDYKLALQYYLEALEEADSSDLNVLSDEYTGLQIKIAEMYEKLGMGEEARLLYRELATSYLQALTDGTQVSANVRPHMIQRDLRVALKTAIFEATTHPEVAKMGLLIHFVLAQTEIATRDPEMAELMNREKDPSHFNLQLPLDSETRKVNAEVWQPFRDELFSARDSEFFFCLRRPGSARTRSSLRSFVGRVSNSERSEEQRVRAEPGRRRQCGVVKRILTALCSVCGIVFGHGGYWVCDTDEACHDAMDGSGWVRHRRHSHVVLQRRIHVLPAIGTTRAA